jgi:hypothetical protein
MEVLERACAGRMPDSHYVLVAAVHNLPNGSMVVHNLLREEWRGLRRGEVGLCHWVGWEASRRRALVVVHTSVASVSDGSAENEAMTVR